jgi:hypothetical protein
MFNGNYIFVFLVLSIGNFGCGAKGYYYLSDFLRSCSYRKSGNEYRFSDCVHLFLQNNEQIIVYSD